MRLSSLSAPVLGALLLSVAQLLNAAPVQFQSGLIQTSLLELYTSEGCSSCPPAEAWISGLKEGRRLWKDLVPVAFHVDYWDHLGWNDPFASKAYTALLGFELSSDVKADENRDHKLYHDFVVLALANAPATASAIPL